MVGVLIFPLSVQSWHTRYSWSSRTLWMASVFGRTKGKGLPHWGQREMSLGLETTVFGFGVPWLHNWRNLILHEVAPVHVCRAHDECAFLSPPEETFYTARAPPGTIQPLLLVLLCFGSRRSSWIFSMQYYSWWSGGPSRFYDLFFLVEQEYVAAYSKDYQLDRISGTRWERRYPPVYFALACQLGTISSEPGDS